jgi:hypothetical protein
VKQIDVSNDKFQQSLEKARKEARDQVSTIKSTFLDVDNVLVAHMLNLEALQVCDVFHVVARFVLSN